MGTIQNYIERFLAKNQHTKRKLLNLQNCCIWGDVQKCQNLTFKVNLLLQKSSESLSFFFIENTNLGAHFLFLTFLNDIDF